MRSRGRKSAVSIECFIVGLRLKQGCPGGSVVKNLPTNTEEVGSVPGSGRSPGEGNSNPL